jgi:alpha-tubulin suppressor-like RCC1 family protein
MEERMRLQRGRKRGWGLLIGAVAVCAMGMALAASAQAAGGSVVGWGYNYYGEASGAAITTGCECALTPAQVEGLHDVTQVASGAYHTLALRSDGTVVGWGYNSEGQLGDGTTESHEAPAPVHGLSNVVAIATGDYQGLALLSNGTVMAWGDNAHGELGQGNTASYGGCSACSSTPILVPGLNNVVAIAASYYYDMALLADGTVRFWGYNQYGESGDGIGTNASENPCYCIDHPVPVPGVSNAVAISAGWYLGSALIADGTVRNWGYNAYGVVGNGTTTEGTECDCVMPVSPVGVSGAKQAAAGGYHSLILFPAGNLVAGGYNYEGQFGDGTETTVGCDCSPVPLPSASGLNVRSVAAAGYHSAAVLTDGSVRTWGYNRYAEIGDGTIEINRPSPTAIGVNGASAVAAGYYNTLALVGPSQSLKVKLAGAGKGSVGSDGVVCPSSTCEGTFSQGLVKILRASPAAGTTFAGFSGPCTGTGPCQVSLAQDQTVTATFGPPKGTKIAKAKIDSRKKKATFSFTAPGAITGFQCKLIAPKKKGKGAHSFKAKAPKWAKCPAKKTYKHLKLGSYTLKVRALDIAGADAKPAVRHFKIKRVKAAH